MVRPKMATVYVEIADLPQVKAAMEAAAARIAELEADVAGLLEALSYTGFDKVGRYWPEFEGWAGGLERSEECHAGGEFNGCMCCAVFSITARVADLIDPPGPETVLPVGWRTMADSVERVAEAGDTGSPAPPPESAYP